MEIDETFTSIEEIKSVLEKDGFTCRISADIDDDMDDDSDFEDEKTNGLQSETDDFSFSSEADEKEIEKWEAELPDLDENEAADEEENYDEVENDCDASENSQSGGDSGDGRSCENYENADVVYFDTFKKRSYVKTYIFQKEIEDGKGFYRLVGFCDAPLS